MWRTKIINTRQRAIGGKTAANLGKITSFLDRELNIAAFRDGSHNGLQVANSGRVRRVCAGVDASMVFFEKAAELKADLLICHHGLSWGDSLKRITGLNYRRLKFLMERDIALYACHLPLDAHPRLGNNAQICRTLGLKKLKPFGCYDGTPLGFSGTLPVSMSFENFKNRARAVFGNGLSAMEFGKKNVRTIAVVSGAAASITAEAGEKGMDVYVSGEPSLEAWNLAQEYKVNAIFAGHYATEIFGVRAVAELLSKRFNLKSGFIDMGVPY